MSKSASEFRDDQVNLRLFHKLPEEFFQLSPEQMYQCFSGPTLIRLQGRSSRWVFISTLLHGNETTGIRALQEFLKSSEPLPVSLLILIGNPQAARYNMRKLPEQRDQNRIWADEALISTPWAQQLLQLVTPLKPWAAIDIHNTTGRGDSYAAISKLNAEHMFLAKEFSSNVVHFSEPHTTLIDAFGEHMPAVVLECGPSEGDEGRRRHLLSYLNSILSLEEMGQTELVDPGLNLFESQARVFVNGQFSFATNQGQGLSLDPDLDLNNFKLLPRGQLWGTYKNRADFEFSVRDLNGLNVTSDHFAISEGQIRVTTPFVPSLITSSVVAVQEDCLCYIMRRIGG